MKTAGTILNNTNAVIVVPQIHPGKAGIPGKLPIHRLPLPPSSEMNAVGKTFDAATTITATAAAVTFPDPTLEVLPDGSRPATGGGVEAIVSTSVFT